MSKNTLLSELINYISANASGNVVVAAPTSGLALDVTGSGRFTGQLTLGSTITNGTFTYTLPAATGTLALTSAIPANPVGGTGTTNYLPKLTGTSTIGNSLLYDTGSAILLGATSASDGQSRLELVNAATVGLKIISTGANGNNTFLSIQASKEWRFVTNRGDLIGGNQGDLIIRNNTDGINHIILNQNGNTSFYSNVGIGTASPSQKLHVSGNILCSDTVFGRNLKPEAFVSVNAGTPSGAGIPLGYSSMNISTITDGNWRSLLSNINDVKGFFWVTLGDAASKDTANYVMAMTSPAYGVSNFGAVSYQDNGWNTGGFEFTTDTVGGTYRLLVRCTSYYSSGNTAYGTIYFLRME